MKELAKVQVPRFVADWYEKKPETWEYRLWEYLVDWHEKEVDDPFREWIDDTPDAFSILVHMSENGYIVPVMEPAELIGEFDTAVSRLEKDLTEYNEWDGWSEGYTWEEGCDFFRYSSDQFLKRTDDLMSILGQIMPVPKSNK